MELKRNKAIAIAAGIVAAVAVLAAGAGFYLESKADELIAKEFSRLTGGRWRLDCGLVEVSFAQRAVTLHDMVIAPDSAVVVSRKRAGKRGRVSVSAGEVFAAGITREGQRIAIRRLRVSSIGVRRGGKNSSGFSAVIGKVIVSEQWREHHSLSENDTTSNTIEGLRIDSGEGLRIAAGRIRHMPANGSTRIEADSLIFDTNHRRLTLAALRMVPTYDKSEFARKSWRHTDWTLMEARGIAIEGVDMVRFMTNRTVAADSIHITGGWIESYKDRNVIRDEWVKPMYHRLVQRLPVCLYVGMVNFSDIAARYGELAFGADEAGEVRFDAISGSVANLTNIPGGSDPWITVNARGQVMDAGDFHVVVHMPVDSLDDRFEMTGRVGPMEMAALNDMARPLANIEIADGHIASVDFHITGSDTRARIDMTLLYNNLMITLLKDHGEHARRFASMVANRIVLHHDNPDARGKRRATESVERDPLRSPFNYLWRAILAASKSTIGL